MNLLGAIDFEKNQLDVIIAIRDSYILAFSISGGIALVVNWGEEGNFLLSVGGYHPAFKRPSNFPPYLEKMRAGLRFLGVIEFNIEGYFAITSNSIQFGARAEIKIELPVVSIYGWLEFNAFGNFSPFFIHFRF